MIPTGSWYALLRRSASAWDAEVSEYLCDYHVDIPAELIAQEPLAQRDASRLLVLSRALAPAIVGESTFSRLSEYLRPGDLLVFNDTRVIPARLKGRKSTGGAVEIFLVEPCAPRCWRVLTRGKKLVPGTLVYIGDGVEAVIEERDGEMAVARFSADDQELFACGAIPLPPYIKREADSRDNQRYQSVFAARDGAVAAPTASLHFTSAIVEGLRQRGVRTATITLHVGLGTFLPVKSERIDEHRMHSEHFHVPAQTLDLVADTRRSGGRVIAVGTTVVRALESCFGHTPLRTGGSTDIFIRPGYSFAVIDGMVTNFHLPDSTLILLVSAFYGRENIQQIYQYAVSQRYRFFSYGDGMLFLP